MSEFYLVRHGQASFGAEDYDKLSELGQQQAKWLGEYFTQRGISFDHVLCGSLLRHRETASGINGAFARQSELEILPALNEFDFESLAKGYLTLFPERRPPSDAPRSEFYRLLKAAMLAWSKDEIPEALLIETWKQFDQRVQQAVQHIRENCYSKRVLVVSSGGAIAVLLSQVLGFEPAQAINVNLQIKNASFSHFYFNSNTVRMSSFNNVPHLDHTDRVGAITFS